MRIAIDTSVFVPAIVTDHRHHARARCRLQAVETGRLEGLASWHSMNETGSVLTRLPVTPRISPLSAWSAVRRLRSVLTLIPPTERIYRTAMARCTARALTSGVIFDALHLVTAEEAGAGAMLTFNHADFIHLIDAGSPRVIVPPDPPAVTL